MPQPYNNLGQILAAGGGAYAANLHRQILPLPIILSKLRMVYPRVTDAELETLSILGKQMITTGHAIEHLPKGSKPSPDIFPEISVPTPGIPSAKRYRVLVGVADGDNETVAYTTVTTENPEDYETIMEMAEEAIHNRLIGYADFAAKFPGSDASSLEYTIIWAIAINGENE